MKKKAFTLIELMLTVMVIAILVSIAIPNYINTVERARAREAVSTLESMRAAEQSYAAERRSFINLTDGAGTAIAGTWEAIGLEDPNLNANNSWIYILNDVPAAGNTFNATASRINGPYSGKTIILDQDGADGGSTWPL
ncbi:MAG: prepilin-type N-terminal cleavage/methylation domain-containing protein [Candidatus Omnitrophica bacterium]|nr:prepilin-type N-terminal cleavage/methylation domain-containing protein [Candidatus Omnitrophota bacterium]